MSDRPIHDALKKLETLPTREAEVGVVARDGDVGATGRVSVPLGKGWTFAAAGHWMREAGYAAAAMLGWKGK